MKQRIKTYLEENASILEAIELNPFPVLLGDQGVFVYANKHALELLEMENLEQLTGKHVMDFTHENSFRQTQLELDQLHQGNPKIQNPKNIITMKGSVLEIESEVKRVSINEGQLDYILIKDANKIDTYEHQYLMQKKHYQTLIDNSIDTVALVTDNVFQYINKAGLKLFGAKHEDEIIGKSVLEFIDSADHSDVLRRTINVIGNPDAPPVIKERQFYRIDGTRRFVESVVMPFDIDNKPSVQVILRDITEQKQNHEHNVKTEKLLTAGQLSAGIAHEIRNPLTSIKGFMQLLEGKIPEENQRYVEIMREEIDKIERITGEMLSLSKPQAIIKKSHNLVTLLEEVITLLEPQATLKNVEIMSNFAVDDIFINSDKQQLKQVFINLIKNAIESMDDGGVITVSLQHQGQGINIFIKDTGCGIPLEMLTQINEPFFTTKGTGTGLGLTICNTILKEYNGELTVESREKEGTIFGVSLPIL
jgi:two-component system, sporulation sensor kinase A